MFCLYSGTSCFQHIQPPTLSPATASASELPSLHLLMHSTLAIEPRAASDGSGSVAYF